MASFTYAAESSSASERSDVFSFIESAIYFAKIIGKHVQYSTVQYSTVQFSHYFFSSTIFHIFDVSPNLLSSPILSPLLTPSPLLFSLILLSHLRTVCRWGNIEALRIFIFTCIRNVPVCVELCLDNILPQGTYSPRSVTSVCVCEIGRAHV